MLSFLNLDTYLLTYYFYRANTVNYIKISALIIEYSGISQEHSIFRFSPLIGSSSKLCNRLSPLLCFYLIIHNLSDVICVSVYYS